MKRRRVASNELIELALNDPDAGLASAASDRTLKGALSAAFSVAKRRRTQAWAGRV